MYVGSKDYVLSLDLHDINREPLIVRAGPDVGQGNVGGCGPPGWGPPLAGPLIPLSGRSTGQPPHSALKSACSQARMAT